MIALLAVLTTFGLGHLWNLFIFSYHQVRATGDTVDGHFHQQQALLRTLPTPNATASSWLKLWWTWRGRADNAFARTWVLGVLSLVFTALTVAVGIFVSYVVSNNDVEVLVDSPFCGPLDVDRYNTAAGTDAWQRYSASVRATSRQYSQNCYRTGTLPAQCSTYVRPRILFTETRENCPFSNLCINIEQPGISMDSGLINVNDAFGLNLQLRDRVKFRVKQTCAFLETKGHYTITNITHEAPNPIRTEEQVNLFFGPTRIANNTFWVKKKMGSRLGTYSML